VDEEAEEVVKAHRIQEDDSAEDPLMEGLLRLQEMMGEDGIDERMIFQVANTALIRGLFLQGMAVYLLGPDHKSLNLKAAMGPMAQSLELPKNTKADQRDLFQLVLHRGEDIIIHTCSDPKTQPYLPAFLKKFSGGMLLLPLWDGKVSYGFLLGFKARAGSLHLNKSQIKKLKGLKAAITAAKRLVRC